MCPASRITRAMLTEIRLRLDNLESEFRRIAECEWDAIAVSSYFAPSDLSSPSPGRCSLAASTAKLLETCSRALKIGGLLFVYGAPRYLPAYAELLDKLGGEGWKLAFKYWNAVQLHESDRAQTLHPSHAGILLFHKVARGRNTPFRLGVVRIPHSYCSACGRNVRDWGGKKHLMNPNGSALSDVWTDLPMRPLADNRMPDDVLQRVNALAGGRLLHVVEMGSPVGTTPRGCSTEGQAQWPASTAYRQRKLPIDRIELADCVDFMEGLLPRYAHNAFDLIFADPPYNLEKLYTNYTDAQAEEEYLAWCDRWLRLCSQLLKPGGAMFVLNLPKWALSHARTLDGLLEFRHWIAWQALAEPRGKLLPAHYALLYYTKPGGEPVFNYEDCPDSPDYCLRTDCVKKRKALGDDRKAPLTDVWFDVHRIRHKRDRDYHPCQLPEKLLKRIILLASNPGEVVFDPFCGVGTTAVVARRLGRHFVTTDVDSRYVNIATRKLEGSHPPQGTRRARSLTAHVM